MLSLLYLYCPVCGSSVRRYKIHAVTRYGTVQPRGYGVRYKLYGPHHSLQTSK